MGIMHVLKTIENNEQLIKVNDELLLKIQNSLYQMLFDLQKHCEKHQIPWSLIGGSILGAVRHQGFIPWDDDIDICMTRAAFESFRQSFDADFSEQYFLRLPGDPGYLLHYPQLQKKGTVMKTVQSAPDSKDGLFIDIFILENTYENKFRRKIHGLQSSFLLFIDSVMRMKACRETILSYSDNDPEVKKAVDSRARFAFLFSFRSLEKWLASTDKCFSKVKKEGRIAVIPSGAKHFFGEIFEREKITETTLLPFGKLKVPTPKIYDYYLCIRYGADYMTLPKEEDRERHAYIALNLCE